MALVPRRLARLETLFPGGAGRSAFGRDQEVLERNVQECAAGFRECLVAVEQLSVDVCPPAARVHDPGPDEQIAVDGDGTSVADEDAGRDRGEAVPRREQAARLVERRGDEAAVDEPRACLVTLVEAESRLVALGALLRRLRQVDTGRIVAAAPAARVVVRRDPAQRKPPCWKCALKKFSEPAVAIAAEAEISSASVAAATIWAKR
jgi:hypothetical protein